jgi:hypothetical protein
MNKEALDANASAEAASLREKTSIGYAINLVMDYGSGRQMTISGTLPLGATKKDFDIELDKLRLATNRQSSLVIQRDIEQTVMMAKKTKASLELMVTEYAKGIEEEIANLSSGPKATHTLVKTQMDNMKAEAANYARNKREEIMRTQADMEKGELLLARIKKELDEG